MSYTTVILAIVLFFIALYFLFWRDPNAPEYKQEDDLLPVTPLREMAERKVALSFKLGWPDNGNRIFRVDQYYKERDIVRIYEVGRYGVMYEASGSLPVSPIRASYSYINLRPEKE